MQGKTKVWPEQKRNVLGYLEMNFCLFSARNQSISLNNIIN